MTTVESSLMNGASQALDGPKQAGRPGSDLDLLERIQSLVELVNARARLAEQARKPDDEVIDALAATAPTDGRRDWSNCVAQGDCVRLCMIILVSSRCIRQRLHALEFLQLLCSPRDW